MKNPDQQSATNRRRQVADSMGVGVALGIILCTALGISGAGSLWRTRRT